MLECECNFNRNKDYSLCIDRVRSKIVVLASNFSKKTSFNYIDKTKISSIFPSDDEIVSVVAIEKTPMINMWYEDLTKEKFVTFMKNLLTFAFAWDA